MVRLKKLALLLLLIGCGSTAAPSQDEPTTGASPTDPAATTGEPPSPAQETTTPPSTAPTPADVDAGVDDDDAGSSHWPGSQAFFFNFPAQRQVPVTPAYGTALLDILRHMHPSFHSTAYDFPNDRVRWGEATSHGIASHLRFAYNVTGKAANGLYVMQDRATLVVEPTIFLSDVGPRVPQSLKGPSFQRTLVAVQANDKPTFLLEDWIAATNGSEVGVDLVKQNQWGTTVRDGVRTTFELTIYALAWAHTVTVTDTSYFQDNPLTRELLAWNTERALRLYDEGSQMPAFKNNAQDDYLAKWKTSPDAAPLRNFARRFFGGAYVAKVLGIPATKE